MSDENTATQPTRTPGSLPDTQAALMMLENFDAMALLLDTTRRVCYMNRTLLEQLDKQADEVIGTSIYDHAPLPWREGASDELDLILDTGESVHTEVIVGNCTVFLRGFPVIDEQGMLTHYAIFLRDITADRRIHDQIVQAEMLRLEVQKDRDLIQKQERFMSMVSHELRNPLAAIRGSLDILERYHDRLDDARRQKHFDRIGQQVETMKNMLHDLLAMRESGTNGFHFQPQPQHFGAYCRMVFRDIQQQYNSTHRFQFTDNGPEARVMIDPALLRHILDNLVGNAIKYTPADGEIRVELSYDKAALVLVVADNGIGIPPEAQARLFEPFYRATNTGQIAGSGLGLVIAQTCVNAHGGTITFDSSEGQGTTFTVRLPLVFAGAEV